MGLETVNYLDDLNINNPVAVDPRSEGDDHFRNLKNGIKNTFPGMAGRAWRVQSKGSGYTVLTTDNMSVIRATTGITLQLTAAATLGNGHMVLVIADGGVVTIDPNASELINNASTIVLADGSMAYVFCDGTEFYAFIYDPTPGNAAQLDVEDQTLTGGVIPTSKDLGTISSGTVTPDCGDRMLQHYSNNGAHTLAPSSNNGSTLVDITNTASAGVVTTSGFTKVTGDPFTTTNGHKFRCHISKGNSGSLLQIQALQ